MRVDNELMKNTAETQQTEQLDERLVRSNQDANNDKPTVSMPIEVAGNSPSGDTITKINLCAFFNRSIQGLAD